MHEDAARKREHLRLVLQTAEWCGEDKTVIVALELRPLVMALGVVSVAVSAAIAGGMV